MRHSKTLLISLIIVSHLTSSIAWADCPNASLLKVGDKVTDCDRIGYSLGYDLQTRKDLIEGDYNKQIIDGQAKQISLKDVTIKMEKDQTDLWKSEAERVRTKLSEKEDAGHKDLFWGILMGIGLTVLSGWAIGQAAHK